MRFYPYLPIFWGNKVNPRKAAKTACSEQKSLEMHSKPTPDGWHKYFNDTEISNIVGDQALVDQHPVELFNALISEKKIITLPYLAKAKYIITQLTPEQVIKYRKEKRVTTANNKANEITGTEQELEICEPELSNQNNIKEEITPTEQALGISESAPSNLNNIKKEEIMQIKQELEFCKIQLSDQLSRLSCYLPGMRQTQTSSGAAG